MKDQPEVLNLKDAAKLLGVCTKTLAKWATEGKVPGFKIGRDWRFLRSKLLEVLDGHRAA
jgi:excisionase family DNA binding protein